ncbi:MAG TPA: AAA family ATPase [Iamia sp.]|nr:AAA family ATPase [Iamia sp.]HXH56211.1 AAA family ATPase [Iamia sp.]
MPCRRDGRPVAEHVTDRRLTTDAVLTQELDLQRWAETHAFPTPADVQDPQSTAVEAMAGNAGLVVVVGPAGTGKTTATARAVHRLRTDRRPVIGLAPSGKAADVLAGQSHCETTTVAGFLTRHTDGRTSSWPAGTTVILDEAGMTATEDLHRLVTLVQRHRWRLAAVGDPAQLPAVGRGGVFAHWCATVPRHVLAVPMRFDQQWEAAASLAVRTGDPRAVDAYDEHGRLRSSHPALIARQVADAHQRHTSKDRTVAITTNTAETARAINTEIQYRLHRTARPRLPLADGTQVGVGDRIATCRNDPDLRTDRGVQVRNRHTWTVTALASSGGLVVSHPERGADRPRRLRGSPRRARLGRHRLRQPGRHRGRRPRGPRARHHPQTRLRRPHPRPLLKSRLGPRPLRLPRPCRCPHRDDHPHP